MTEDNYYDLKVTLNSAVINEDGTRVASITLQEIHEEIPVGTEIYYDCWKYYECGDGSKIKYCDYTSNGMCGCRDVSSSECSDEDDDAEDDENTNAPAETCEYNCYCIMKEIEYSHCVLSDCSAEQMPCELGCDHETGRCEIGENSQVNEEVTCRFIGSDTTQSCWYKSAHAGESGCEGVEECTMQVFGVGGVGGFDLNWYSSCGGYAHTVLDYEDDYIEFYCGPDEEYSSEKFSRASWVCEDEEEVVEQGGDGSCKNEATWKFYATQYCAENSASGELDDFRAFESCGKDLIVRPREWHVEVIGNEQGVNYTCQGCQLEGGCYPLGYRKSGNYCSEGGFLEQVSDEGSCENNFECKSNLCIDNGCVSSGVWRKFMSWLKGLFG